MFGETPPGISVTSPGISSILGNLHLGGKELQQEKISGTEWSSGSSVDQLVQSISADLDLDKDEKNSLSPCGGGSLSPRNKTVPMEEGDVNIAQLEESKTPRLKRAFSEPQIFTQSLKLDLEGEPRSDARAFANIMKENQMLRENLMKLKTKNNEIIAINHDWDKSYNNLVQQHAELQKQFQKHSEQLTSEIAKKEEEKNRMKMKLERFFNEGSMDEKTLLNEEKEEKNKIMKREQAAIQTAKEFQMKCQQLDHMLRQTNQQKMSLEREMQRLSMCVDTQKQQQQQKAFAGFDSSSQSHMTFGSDVGEMELLRQQLQTYVEDFNAEKSEKQRLIQENDEIKMNLAAKADENQHLKTQMEIYEKDFARMREKRIQEMRKNNQMSRNMVPPVFPSSATSSASSRHNHEVQRKLHEYNNLVVEKEHIQDRMSSLESQGVTPWSTACYNNSNGNDNNHRNNGLSNSLPPYPHAQGFSSHTFNHSLPRSAPPFSFGSAATHTIDSNSDSFFNEKSMRDRGILSRSMEKSSTSDTPMNTFNNLTNSSSCWSYFGR